MAGHDGVAFSRKKSSAADIGPISEADLSTLTYKRFRQIQPLMSVGDIGDKLAIVKDKAKQPPVPKGLEYTERLMNLPVARTFLSSPKKGTRGNTKS